MVRENITEHGTKGNLGAVRKEPSAGHASFGIRQSD
jgi:hypothetical protein